MNSGLTFAEAYLRRKAKEVADAKQRRYESSSQVSNINDLKQVIDNLTHEIEKDVPLKTIKLALKAIPSNFTKYVSNCTDSDGLDILHHAIINNKPALVTFLLAESNYFSTSHIPHLNPYAHLAAMIGQKECLRAILQHRPAYFFPCHKPSHAIQLPDHIMKKLRLTERNMRTKGSERLIEKVKCLTKAAEIKMRQVNDSTSPDVIGVLDKEIGNVDQSFQKQKKHIKMLPQRRDIRHSIASLKKEPLSPDLLKDTAQKSNWMSGLSKFIPRLKPRRRQHKITLYRDIASHFEQGVVRGAGEPIRLEYDKSWRPEQKAKVISRTESQDNLSISTLSRQSLGQPRKRESLIKRMSIPNASETTHYSNKNVKALGIDFGVRGKKKYKDFKVKLPVHEHRDKSDAYMNKTPMTLASERGHDECVQLMLEMVLVKRNPTISSNEALVLATKAQCPETILLLLDKPYSQTDYQNAVLLSIREMDPVSLTALLSKGRSFRSLFDGMNLFHILYTQCVISGHRFEYMPEMTRALIACKEDVNSHNIPRTFPMYTLINCAFNITIGNQIFFFIECLYILLDNKANPHFDEDKQKKQSTRATQSFARKSFTSAINCIFGSAKDSINFFEKSYWSKLFMKKFVTTIEIYDRTPRRILNTVLFDYMEAVCELGLDRTIVRCLLRYGANPDHQIHGKYAVNVYFDKILPHMTRFEIINSLALYHQELDTLRIVCKSMSNHHLTRSMLVFLQDHLLSCPIQALPITRDFAALVDKMVRNPRPLVDIAALSVWILVKRNKTKLRLLQIPQECLSLIIP
ncbi:hypothetical protein PoB_006454300 [Plakobranchus ocellatus]|uniref:Uncharacterized protein n=1 Tax=Plakobranchus ocellatus TaxID=259542 RepID=A0AAV4D1J9_9GAST|nr:hypothetical protein PoB_006454300 [Plakobranchus ocellatus]